MGHVKQRAINFATVSNNLIKCIWSKIINYPNVEFLEIIVNSDHEGIIHNIHILKNNIKQINKMYFLGNMCMIKKVDESMCNVYIGKKC